MNILLIDSLHPIFTEKIAKAGFNITDAHNYNQEEILPLLTNTDGIVLRSKMKIDSFIIDKATVLKFIARAGSGLENIDQEYCQKKNIQVINSPEGNSTAVAEHAIGMLLGIMNNIPNSHQEVANGIWNRTHNRGIELEGKTIGIIGFGNTGKAMCQRLSAFNVTILVYDKYVDWDQGQYPFIRKSSLDEIFDQTDILSLHIPLTDETKHMINSSSIRQFKKNIILINTSRGPIVKTTDLIVEIKKGKIKAACLDVLEFEDVTFESNYSYKDNPLFRELINLKQVLITPHIAGWTHESNKKIASVLADKIIAQFASA